MEDHDFERPNKPNDVSLETYVETRFNLLNELIKAMDSRIAERFKQVDERYQQRFEAQQQAIFKSEISIDKRLESMNEFRQSLNDQSTKLMPRTETLAIVGTVSEKVSNLEKRLDLREGEVTGSRGTIEDRRSNTGLWISVGAVIFSAITLIVSLIARFSNSN